MFSIVNASNLPAAWCVTDIFIVTAVLQPHSPQGLQDELAVLVMLLVLHCAVRSAAPWLQWTSGFYKVRM